MNKREIKRILRQLDKEQDKECDANCKKCKYNLGENIDCCDVYLLNWLADHDEIIKKIKENKKNNKKKNNV